MATDRSQTNGASRSDKAIPPTRPNRPPRQACEDHIASLSSPPQAKVGVRLRTHPPSSNNDTVKGPLNASFIHTWCEGAESGTGRLPTGLAGRRFPWKRLPRKRGRAPNCPYQPRVDAEELAVHFAHSRQPSLRPAPADDAKRQPGVQAKRQPHRVCQQTDGAARSMPKLCITRRPSCKTWSYRVALDRNSSILAVDCWRLSLTARTTMRSTSKGVHRLGPLAATAESS